MSRQKTESTHAISTIKTHATESEELYALAREVVRWGIDNGLLHRPPDEPTDEPETGEDMVAESVNEVVRLSRGNSAKRDQYAELFDEPDQTAEETAEIESEPEPDDETDEGHEDEEEAV